MTHFECFIENIMTKKNVLSPISLVNTAKKLPNIEAIILSQVIIEVSSAKILKLLINNNNLNENIVFIQQYYSQTVNTFSKSQLISDLPEQSQILHYQTAIVINFIFIMRHHEKTKSEHPLRYSEYINSNRLYQHLNDLQIDESDLRTNPYRYNVIKININQEQQIKQLKSKWIPSRQNMQLMNKKLKQLRSIQNQENKKDDGIRAQTSFGQRLYPSHNAHQFITQVKGVASSLQINRPKTVRGTQNGTKVSLRNSTTQKNYMNRIRKIKISPKVKQEEDEQFMINKKNENETIPHLFKPNLKKKCVEDNLNIMAMMIKRKIKVLDRNQMQKYITNLMGRNKID